MPMAVPLANQTSSYRSSTAKYLQNAYFLHLSQYLLQYFSFYFLNKNIGFHGQSIDQYGTPRTYSKVIILSPEDINGVLKNATQDPTQNGRMVS
ncbi:unnamed protein product [Macrosiphum euphorbiae]|uniref:Uncharacterized protein n=1 Tax=Macrosiphum euphorbiae TaxID=13131 RepID=A0AAV0X7Y3_9HEMI|nr:unnamed protein product [Macrosiphum euphorbiae]